MTARRLFDVLTLILAAFTAINPHWIETLTGIDPDHGSGSLELTVCVLVVIAVTYDLGRAVARRGRR